MARCTKIRFSFFTGGLNMARCTKIRCKMLQLCVFAVYVCLEENSSGTFVGSNPLYTPWRSFPKSFKKNRFLFSSLQFGERPL